jgi:hypothetical protein
MIESTGRQQLSLQTSATSGLVEGQVAVIAGQLADVHDQLVAWLDGEAYVNISASWQGSTGKLVTLSVSSTEPDEDDDFEEEDA